MKVTPLPTRSVTRAFTLACELFSAPVTHTQVPSLMPRSAASPGLISTNISCCNSASHRFERVSSPPPSYSTSRPEVRLNGQSFAMPFSIDALCTLQPIFGHRTCLASGSVGYFSTKPTLVLDEPTGGEEQRKVLRDAFLDRRLLHAEADIRQPELSGIGKCRILRDQIHPRRIDRLAVDGDRIGQVPRLCARLAVAIRVAAMAEHHPLNTAGQVGRPAHLVNGVAADPLDDSAFLWCQVPVPAELLQHGHRELRIAVGQLRALRVGPLREKRLAISLHAETGSERASAIHDVKARVVEIGRARMPEFRLAPAGPGKAVIVAADLRIVLRRAQRNQVELGLVAHMRLETLGRLPAIAGRPTPAVHLPQHVLGHGPVAFDLHVLEHQVGETELLRQQINDLVVVLHLEARLDDLLAPLQRSEEHTSELQSLMRISYAVFCLKKKKNTH